jgi:hypothetical protein
LAQDAGLVGSAVIPWNILSRPAFEENSDGVSWAFFRASVTFQKTA